MIAWRLDLYAECFSELRKAGVKSNDIYMTNEIRIIPCNNELERLGIVAKASEFVREFTLFDEETFEDLYGTLRIERCGRFFCDKKYFIKNTDKFYTRAFIHSINGKAYAEIFSDKRKCIVAYVRM